MPHFGIKNVGIYPLIVYCAAVVMVMLFELVLHLRTNKNSFDVSQAPQAEMKDGKVEITTKQTEQVKIKAPQKPIEKVLYYVTIP